MDLNLSTFKKLNRYMKTGSSHAIHSCQHLKSSPISSQFFFLCPWKHQKTTKCSNCRQRIVLVCLTIFWVFDFSKVYTNETLAWNGSKLLNDLKQNSLRGSCVVFLVHDSYLKLWLYHCGKYQNLWSVNWVQPVWKIGQPIF